MSGADRGQLSPYPLPVAFAVMLIVLGYVFYVGWIA